MRTRSTSSSDGDDGDNAELKAWAESTRPALEHHLQMEGI